MATILRVTLVTHLQWIAKWMIAAVMKVTPAQVLIMSQLVRVNRIIGSAVHRPRALIVLRLLINSLAMRRVMLTTHDPWIDRWMRAAMIIATPLQVCKSSQVWLSNNMMRLYIGLRPPLNPPVGRNGK